MEMKKMREDLVAFGLLGDQQERVFPVPDPSNYIYVPLVTFYDMPEPPALPKSLRKDEDTSEDA